MFGYSCYCSAEAVYSWVVKIFQIHDSFWICIETFLLFSYAIVRLSGVDL